MSKKRVKVQARLHTKHRLLSSVTVDGKELVFRSAELRSAPNNRGMDLVLVLPHSSYDVQVIAGDKPPDEARVEKCPGPETCPHLAAAAQDSPDERENAANRRAACAAAGEFCSQSRSHETLDR